MARDAGRMLIPLLWAAPVLGGCGANPKAPEVSPEFPFFSKPMEFSGVLDRGKRKLRYVDRLAMSRSSLEIRRELEAAGQNDASLNESGYSAAVSRFWFDAPEWGHLQHGFPQRDYRDCHKDVEVVRELHARFSYKVNREGKWFPVVPHEVEGVPLERGDRLVLEVEVKNPFDCENIDFVFATYWNGILSNGP